MNRVSVYHPVSRAAFSLLIATAFSAFAAGALAQEKKESAAGAPPSTAAVKPAQPGALPQREIQQAKPKGDEFVGPPYQNPKIVSRLSDTANPANPPKPVVDIPKPTVVLKPGEVPGIRFDTPIYDFGKVRAGPDIEHDYWFTNTGTGPLEILRVKPS